MPPAYLASSAFATFGAGVFVSVRHFLMALTKTLAYYATEFITAVICFMIQAPPSLTFAVKLGGVFSKSGVHLVPCSQILD